MCFTNFVLVDNLFFALLFPLKIYIHILCYFLVHLLLVKSPMKKWVVPEVRLYWMHWIYLHRHFLLLCHQGDDNEKSLTEIHIKINILTGRPVETILQEPLARWFLLGYKALFWWINNMLCFAYTHFPFLLKHSVLQQLLCKCINNSCCEVNG